MSDIPIIFAAELQRLPATAVFLSAATTGQMRQYTVAGWSVAVVEGFSATGAVDLAGVPATQKTDAEISAPTLLSCEAPRLKPDTARRIAAWKPAIVKINCAFHGVADARDLAASLADAGYHVVAVYSQPPRPKGRGYQLQKSPVHLLAEIHEIPVFTPTSLKTEDAQATFKALNLDITVVAAYGLILPLAILETPRKGCINIHGSLLPRWRGAAPIHRAILAGDAMTGVTIMEMDVGLDTGPIILTQEIPVSPTTTTAALHDEMARVGAQVLIEALSGYLSGTLKPHPQLEEEIGRAHV